MGAVNRMLSDLQITKQDFKRQDEIKHLIKLINLNQHGDIRQVVDLDLEGLIDFFLQVGFFIKGNTSAKASVFMPALFTRLHLVCMQSDFKYPQFKNLFNPNFH